MGKPVLLYDGFCKLCNNIVRLLKYIDKKEKLIMLPFEDFDQTESYDRNSVVLIHNNNAYYKTDAIFQTIKITGGIYKVFLVFTILPKCLLISIYDVIALNRYRIFGKTNSCKM